MCCVLLAVYVANITLAGMSVNQKISLVNLFLALGLAHAHLLLNVSQGLGEPTLAVQAVHPAIDQFESSDVVDLGHGGCLSVSDAIIAHLEGLSTKKSQEVETNLS
jgi:hypothetical protein